MEDCDGCASNGNNHAGDFYQACVALHKDGVIAFQGRISGSEEFVTFDAKAGAILAEQGQPVRVLR